MNSRALHLPCAMALIWGWSFIIGGCGSAGVNSGDAASEAQNDQTDKTPVAPGEDPSSPGSVGQVSPEGGENGGTPVDAPPPEFRLSLRNTLDVAVDVTVRQFMGDETREYAFVNVPPATVAFLTVSGDIDTVLLFVSAVDGTGATTAAYHAGEDFDGIAPLEIAIDRSFLSPASDPGNEPPGDPDGDGDQDSPSPYAPPTIELLEPAHNLALPLGSTFAVQWSDSSEAFDAVIVVWLEPVSAVFGADRVQLSPTVAERGDGINDRIQVLVQGVEPGQYRVVGEIFDGHEARSSAAPGRIDVFRDARNEAPVITLQSPSAPATMRNGDRISVQWTDSDADDNAVISFSLASDVASPQRWTYPLGGAIAEDPDGVWDAAELVISGVLPGVYDLEAVISDGTLSGSSRLSRLVVVVPDVQNSPPSIDLMEPSRAVTVAWDEVLLMSWQDADDNDNAVIALMLDPDLDASSPDGDEIVMFSALAEDPDGPGNDEIRLGLPPEIPIGQYHLVATITDGRISAHAAALGTVTVIDSRPGGIEPLPDPLVTVDRNGLPRFLRAGDAFAFDARIQNVQGHEVSVSLHNDLMHVDTAGAMNWSMRSGEVCAFVINTGLLAIPNQAASRWFDVTVTVSAPPGDGGGRVLASDTVDAALWLRQELEIVDVELTGIHCDEPNGWRGPEPAGLSFSWYGGGFLTEVEIPAPVEFWLALDGQWPPFLPIDGPETHYRLMTSVESPGVMNAGFIPWEAISHVHPGRYALVAVVRHPVYGDLVHGLDLAPVDVCRVEEGMEGNVSLP